MLLAHLVTLASLVALAAAASAPFTVVRSPMVVGRHRMFPRNIDVEEEVSGNVTMYMSQLFEMDANFPSRNVFRNPWYLRYVTKAESSVTYTADANAVGYAAMVMLTETPSKMYLQTLLYSIIDVWTNGYYFSGDITECFFSSPHADDIVPRLLLSPSCVSKVPREPMNSEYFFKHYYDGTVMQLVEFIQYYYSYMDQSLAVKIDQLVDDLNKGWVYNCESRIDAMERLFVLFEIPFLQPSLSRGPGVLVFLREDTKGVFSLLTKFFDKFAAPDTQALVVDIPPSCKEVFHTVEYKWENGDYHAKLVSLNQVRFIKGVRGTHIAHDELVKFNECAVYLNKHAYIITFKVDIENREIVANIHEARNHIELVINTDMRPLTYDYLNNYVAAFSDLALTSSVKFAERKVLESMLGDNRLIDCYSKGKCAPVNIRKFEAISEPSCFQVSGSDIKFYHACQKLKDPMTSDAAVIYLYQNSNKMFASAISMKPETIVKIENSQGDLIIVQKIPYVDRISVGNIPDFFVKRIEYLNIHKYLGLPLIGIQSDGDYRFHVLYGPALEEIKQREGITLFHIEALLSLYDILDVKASGVTILEFQHICEIFHLPIDNESIKEVVRHYTTGSYFNWFNGLTYAFTPPDRVVQQNSLARYSLNPDIQRDELDLISNILNSTLHNLKAHPYILKEDGNVRMQLHTLKSLESSHPGEIWMQIYETHKVAQFLLEEGFVIMPCLDNEGRLTTTIISLNSEMSTIQNQRYCGLEIVGLKNSDTQDDYEAIQALSVLLTVGYDIYSNSIFGGDLFLKNMDVVLKLVDISHKEDLPLYFDESDIERKITLYNHEPFRKAFGKWLWVTQKFNTWSNAPTIDVNQVIKTSPVYIPFLDDTIEFINVGIINELTKTIDVVTPKTHTQMIPALFPYSKETGKLFSYTDTAMKSFEAAIDSLIDIVNIYISLLDSSTTIQADAKFVKFVETTKNDINSPPFHSNSLSDKKLLNVLTSYLGTGNNRPEVRRLSHTDSPSDVIYQHGRHLVFIVLKTITTRGFNRPYEEEDDDMIDSLIEKYSKGQQTKITPLEIFLGLSELRRFSKSIERPSGDRSYTSPPDELSIMGKLLYEIITNENIAECSICLSPILASDATEYKELKCSHGFHRECIGQWRARSRTCPICRMNTD